MDQENFETQKQTPKPANHTTLTLQKAVDLGEYDPEFLATFAEWHDLTPHLQWQLVRKGLINRRQSLTINWAEIANQPDYSKKPHLKPIQESIQKQLHKLQEDEEYLQNYFLNR